MLTREQTIKAMQEEAKERQRAAGERGKEGGRGKKKTLLPILGAALRVC
jgi:hypothetical protein